MAELSILWETLSGTGDSNTGGYDDTTMFQLFRSLFSRSANLGGVSPDFQNELAVSGTASPVAVNTGAGLVYGIPYFNTASVNVAVPTPAASTRIDRVVLRADWTAKTVRITRIAGTEGGGAPSLTQTPGTTWDVPLAQASITTGGVITLTDQREWLGGIGDDTVDNTKIANMAEATVKGRASGAGTGDPIDLTAAQVRTIANVSDGADATGVAIHAASSKTTPVDADTVGLIDSEASNVLKKTSIANLKAVFGVELGTIIVPILTDAITAGAGVTVFGNVSKGWLNVNQLPAAATVKLFLYVTANTSNTVVIDVTTETQAGSAATISSVINVGTGIGSFLSADIKASINTAHRVFAIQGSKNTTGSVTITSAQLVIEW